jgi:hypothetical protein
VRTWVGWALVAVGCGSPDPATHDARVIDSDEDTDAPIDTPPPPCDVTMPFGDAQPLQGINTTSDEMYAWLTPDELTIYFTSAASGSSDRDIYVGTRASTTAPFTGVKKLPGVNTNGTEERPVLSSDGKTLYADSVTEILVATRDNTTDDFGAFAPLAEVNSGSNDFGPWVTTDGRTMYLASPRDTGTTSNVQIHVSTRANTTAPWNTPILVPELNSGGFDGTPVVSEDGLEMFIESARPGGPTRIYRAIRSSTSDPFGMPQEVTELVAGAPVAPTWLSADRCRLIYLRTVTGNAFDLWIAARPPP